MHIVNQEQAARPAGRYSTNIHQDRRGGHSRIRLTVSHTGELLWCERYEGYGPGELRGCGPSIAFLPAELRDLCEERIAGFFPGSMLWRGDASRGAQ